MTGLPVSTTHPLVTELASRRLLQRSAGGDHEIGLNLRLLASNGYVAPALHECAPQVLSPLAAGRIALPRHPPGDIRSAVSMFFDQTVLARPHSTALASSTASSGLPKRVTVSTSPKISWWNAGVLPSYLAEDRRATKNPSHSAGSPSR